MVGCGGGGGTDGDRATFYSCDDVKTGSDGTETRLCNEFTFVDDQYLDSAIQGNKAEWCGFLGPNETATWGTTPCPVDSSLSGTCDVSNPSDDPKIKSYHYFDTLNGVPMVVPVSAGAGCMLASK
jgi:hypothetical protein